MRQYTSFMGQEGITDGNDAVQQILAQSEDYKDDGNAYLVRVSTAYWKSQRRLGHLTKVTEQGEVITEIITEDYKITDKPIYDTLINKVFIVQLLLNQGTLLTTGKEKRKNVEKV